MTFLREMIGLGCIGGGILAIVGDAVLRHGEAFWYVAIFGLLAILAGYKILHGPGGSG